MASLPSAPGSHDTPDRSDKIAIPRLEGRREKPKEKPRQPKPPKSRTQRACDNCRRRKVRCTGEPLQCKNCAEQGATCVYSMARRDRFKEATQKNAELVTLLKQLLLHVDQEGSTLIDKHLESLQDDTAPPQSASDMLGKHSRASTPSEAASYASESSDNDPDPVDEDILHDRESRATGFVGSNSSAQWFRSLKNRVGSTGGDSELYGLTNSPSNSAVVVGLGHPSSRSSYSGRQIHRHGAGLRVSNSTFYLDDDDLEADVMVDPNELPPPEMASELFDYYILTIHDSFPIVPATFVDQFRKWNQSRQLGRSYRVPEEWRAMLNLVFAIGAQYARLTQANAYGEERVDILYMTRACRILRLDRIATSLPAPSLMFIQALGLLSLYYLTIGQVSRAWMMVGISLRFGLAAGLHLRNDDPSAMLEKKETLVRTWWSLHSIESLLCAIIGRPCIIPDNECTVPLPQVSPKASYSDGSAPSSMPSSTRGDSDTVTRSSFLGARVTIALIMQRTLAKLYSPQLSMDSWDQVQTDITILIREIDDWALQARLAGLSPAHSFEEDTVERAKLILGFHYYSTKLLICRPCLCRIERRNKAQSDASADFYQRTADMCVTSAQAITRLLPDAVDPKFIYEQSPWWCIVHNIMQALAVFLHKMSLGAGHDFHDGEELANNIRKLIRWLHALSANNTVADRACQIAVDLIRASSPRIHVEIPDMGSTTSSKPDHHGSRHTPHSHPSPSSTTGSSGQVHQPKTQSLPSGPLGTQPFQPPNMPTQGAYNTNALLNLSPTVPMTSPQDTFLASTASAMTPQAQYPTTQGLTRQSFMPQADLAPGQFGTQPAVTMQPGFDTFQFSPDLSFGTGMQMPIIFGNPFSTNFDQVEVFAGMFGSGNGSSTRMDEGRGAGTGTGTGTGAGLEQAFGGAASGVSGTDGDW